jgi:hypothetical protein
MDKSILEAPKPNLYADCISEQFSLPIPLLRKTKSGEDALAPCIVLSETLKRQCRKNAYAETLAAFDGKPPKIDEPGSEVWKQEYENNHGAWCLFNAVRVPGDLSTKLWYSKDQITNDYTDAEIGIMFSEYIIVLMSQTNMLQFDEDDQNSVSKLMDQIIHQNTVEETSFLFSSYTTVSFARLTRRLVAENLTLRQQIGLSGLPLDDISLSQKIQSEEQSA